MNITQNSSDSAAIQELGERLARYRLNRNQTQGTLADEAGISRRTLIRLENGESVQITSLIRVLRAHGLLHNLDALVPAPPPSPIQQVKLQGRVRQRASSRESTKREAATWSWGDEE